MDINKIYGDTKKTEKFKKRVNALKDIDSFESKLKKYNKQIENIKAQRDKIYAHSDKKYFYDNGKIADEFKVTYNDIDEILHLIYKELNVLSIDYNRCAYSNYPSTLNDYLHIINRL